MLLIAPVTFLVCERLAVSAVPFLMVIVLMIVFVGSCWLRYL
jgi:Na+/H+ antiporter NhaD/arsenite permease-like protein